MNKLTPKQKLLVELIHYLAYGTQSELGLTLKELEAFLQKPIAAKGGRNCLQCLNDEGLAFINELKTFMNELDHVG